MDPEIEDCYNSVIDVTAVLTESKNTSDYWRRLKQRLSEESNKVWQIVTGWKMPVKDGKMRADLANTKELLHFIQSVPSPNAEPFKQWLAQMGKERFEESRNVAKYGKNCRKCKYALVILAICQIP